MDNFLIYSWPNMLHPSYITVFLLCFTTQALGWFIVYTCDFPALRIDCLAFCGVFEFLRYSGRLPPGDLGTSFSFLFPRLQSCLALFCPVALSCLNFSYQLVYET